MKTYSVISVDGNEADDTGLAKSGSEKYTNYEHEMMSSTATDVYNFIAVNSGTITIGTNTTNNAGVQKFLSSTTANSGVGLRTFGTPIRLKGSEVFTYIFNPQTFANTTSRLGIHDSTSSSDANNGVYFEISTSGVLTLKTADNGTRTTSATIATLVINTWYKVKFTVNSNATSVLAELFDASGVLIGSVTQTTNIPNNTRALNICAITTNSGTTATALIDVDFIGTKLTLTR